MPWLLALRNPSYLSMIKKQNLAGDDGSVTIARALDFTWRENSPAEWLTDGRDIQVSLMSHTWERRYRPVATKFSVAQSLW